MYKIMSIALPFVAAMAAVSAAHAEDATQNAPTQPSIPYRDANATAQDFPADASKVTMERRADGTVIYDLHGQGMQAVTATRDADGKLRYHCDDAAEHAAAGTVTLDEK